MTFFIFFKKKTFQNTIRLSNGFDPDQDRRSVGLDDDLCPKSLQSISTDDNKSRR